MIIFEQEFGVTDFQLLLLTNLRLREATCQQKVSSFEFLANQNNLKEALCMSEQRPTLFALV